MALQINDSFQINSAVPIDTRIMLTKNEMLNVDENLMPDVYFAICTDGKFYLYNKTNSVDPTTGKFRVLEGSGSAKIDKWVSKNSYNTDDLVVYNNAIYQCIATNNDTVFDKTKWKVLGSDFKIEEWATGKDYKEKDLVIYSGKLYQCTTSPQAGNTTFDDTEWLNLSGETVFTKVDKTTIDLATDLATGNYILNGEIKGITFANEVSSVLVDGDVYTITTLSGKVYSFDIVKGTKVEDKFATETKVDDKIHDSLYETIIEHYEKSDVSVVGALEIVSDTSSPSATQIKLSDVTPVIGWTPVGGEYALLVPEHDVTTYMPRTETYTKTEVDEKIGEAECSTTEELEIYGVEDLFGIPDGTKIPEKTLHMELFKKIFQKIIHPTYVPPVLKVVADKVLVEKGVATDVVLTPTFTKNDAGDVNTVTVYKDGVQVDTQATTSVSPYTLSAVNLTAEATYKYEVAYDEGAVKKNNKGDDDRTGIIEAGTIFKEVKIKPVLATYVGVVDNGNVDETNIVANCEKLIRENTTLTKKVSPVFQTVVFATTGTLTSIINQNNYEVLSSFTKTVVSIGGENYNVYALENINVNNFAYTFKF